LEVTQLRDNPLGQSLFAAEPCARWRLPKGLEEISGLAVTSEGRLVGHDDERAVIYEIDVETGAVAERVRLGDPVARGDFEGLAIGGGAVFLVTSDGLIHCFAEAGGRRRDDFEIFDSGLSAIAEIEGVAWDAPGGRLILACKSSHSAALNGALVLYAWSPDAPDQHARPCLTVPAYALAEAVGARAFHPSGLEIDARTGRIVLVASTEKAIVELDAGGGLLASRLLGAQHRQPEGVTIMPDGSLVIADEAHGGAASLTCYARLA
jgi:uncharacterized protein YjiK